MAVFPETNGPIRISRRGFAGGLVGLAVAGPSATAARAQVPPRLQAAVTAIRAYANAHKAAFNLPGMTLGLIAPGGFSTTLDVGLANADNGRAIDPETLFQVGSISKLMAAFVIHRLAAEGRLALTDTVGQLLPEVSIANGLGITVQQLLDHRTGLPADAPLFPDGGLWLGFKPGTDWSYSNTGYDILGKIAEKVGGRPLARQLRDMLFQPLGMNRTRGAIVGSDRTQFAQGYTAADDTIPYARGVPLAPAGWVDVTFAAGSVASTASDMNKLLAALAAGLEGTPLPGLNLAQTRAYLTHAAPADGDMTYGNGLMHVAEGGRRYLHHTGGMVSFSSAFHIDTASRAGAFASSSLTGLAGYRPRTLTKFAADALTAAMAGRPIPAAPRLDTLLPNAAAFVGHYSGPAGAFEIIAGAPLTISANGRSAQLQPFGGDLFRTTHPDFRRFSLMFDRTGGRITGAAWGPDQYARRGTKGAIVPSDPALARLAGRYVNDSPWWGLIEVVERGGKLWMGTETPLVPIGDNLWRAGESKSSAERVRFANPIDGRPQVFVFSGEKFVRHDI